jgi:hypothetical protein
MRRAGPRLRALSFYPKSPLSFKIITQAHCIYFITAFSLRKSSELKKLPALQIIPLLDSLPHGKTFPGQGAGAGHGLKEAAFFYRGKEEPHGGPLGICRQAEKFIFPVDVVNSRGGFSPAAAGQIVQQGLEAHGGKAGGIGLNEYTAIPRDNAKAVFLGRRITGKLGQGPLIRRPAAPGANRAAGETGQGRKFRQNFLKIDIK